MEKLTQELVPYEAVYICDNCNKGEMEYTGNVSNKGLEHKCNQCGHIQNLLDKYPVVRYAYKTKSI